MLVLLVVALMVVPVLTLSWVVHNVGIYRRKGPRRSLTPATALHLKDFNGRTINADWQSLAHCRRIDIVVDEDHKHFVDAGPLRAPMP